MRTKNLSDSEVLDLAFDVISREGFDSFTLKQVGHATHLSPSSLIKRFKNKKNLAQLARDHRWDKNLSLDVQRSGYKEKGIAGLFKMVEIIGESVKSYRLGEHARWLGTESLHPKSKKKVSKYFSTTRSILQGHITEAQLERRLDTNIDPEALALNLEAFIQGVIFQFIFLPDRCGIKSILNERVNFFLNPYLRT
ncbi:MAG: hypothetical protein CL677_08090 [Bdellovibrionaceae bacterium]|nr:hypothetical protein [Pseudobdellovibrionaceae bacterium]|tara:strand:+ start:84144 stop:84728 length:585 start_codon:yes stop_codon:yes gene_type:complete